MKKPLQFPMGLDINQNRTQVDSTFSTLHDITGVFYDESYSPIWTKKETLDSENILFDKKGNRFEIKNGHLYKNADIVFDVESTGFKREAFEPHSDCFDIKNSKEAYVTLSDVFIPTIHYDGSTIVGSQPLFTTGTIVHQRVRIINNKPVYVAVYLNDSNVAKVYTLSDGVEDTHDFQWIANRYAVSSNHPVPSFTTAANDHKVLYEPIIFISNYNDDILVTVASNAGQPMKTTDFYTDRFIIHEGTVFTTVAFNTGSVPVSTEVNENITVLSSILSQSVTRTGILAYSNDNGTTYYETKDTTSTQLTFDAGYVPTEVEDDGTWKTYNYVETTTTFDIDVNGDGNLHDIKAIFNFAGSNAPKQDTEEISVTEGTQAQYAYTCNTTSMLSGVNYTVAFYYYNNQQTAAQKVSVVIPMNNVGYNYTFVNHYTTTASATSGVNPNIFNDDGKMWCLFDAALDTKATTASTYYIPWESVITGITYAGTTATVAYNITKSGNFNNTYCVYRGASFALGQSWCREAVYWSTKTGTELAQNSTTVNCLDEVFDSAFGARYDTGILNNASMYYEATYSGSTDLSASCNLVPYHNAGSRARLNDYWNIVYSLNLRSGISYSEDEDYIGTLTAEWNDIHSDTYIIADGTNLYYQKANKDYVKISIVNENSMKLVENKYLVVNTTSYWNCYDIEKEKSYHYASDYTNRCFAGNSTPVGQKFFNGRIESSVVTLATTAINANYLVTNEGISSISIGPSSYKRLLKGNEVFFCSAVPVNSREKIDVYYSNTSNSAVYAYSYIVGKYNKVRTINPDMIGILYPLASGAYTLYSPNIFTEFLVTYNNRDAVIDGDLAYQLLFANNTMPVMLYSTATQLENVQAIFVIQSQFYGIIDDKIYALIYSNGTLMEADCIIDITGMQYLGGLPTIAYFYSPMNRSLYSFTGDANLTLLYETTDISEVYLTKYNTGTQTLYICTDKGIFLISTMCMTRLDIYNVEDIFFTDKGWTAIRYTDNAHENHFISFVSYYKRDEYKPERMVFETKLFGGGDKTNTNINKYQVTLINHGYNDNDKVKWRVETLTDSGLIQIHENEKEIKPSDWDVFNQHQFDITPNFTKGQGVAIVIDTPWAISNITADVNSDNGTTVVKNNRFSI